MTAFLNGRGFAAGPGGVGRYVTEVARRLPGLEVLSPPAGMARPGVGQAWEQWSLPRRAQAGTLLSLANSGPSRHPDHVVVVHDILPLSHPRSVSPAFARLQAKLMPPMVRSAQAVVTVSASVRNELAAMLQVDMDRIHVIAPGVAVNAVERTRVQAKHRLGLDPSRPLVAGLVSSIPRKNSAALLRVLELVAERRKHSQLLVAGLDGPAHVFGRSSIRATSKTVRDLGPVDDLVLHDLYRAADIFVSLSTAEGFGLPAVEAAAHGAAVVSTRIPSVADHLGASAMQVDGVGQAIERVVSLLDDPIRRDEMSAEARELLMPLTWDRTASKIGALIGHAVGPGPDPLNLDAETRELSWEMS